MHHLDAGLLAEHRHREMAERADADGGVFHRAGIGLAGCDHVGKILVRPLGVRGEDIRRGADQEHRHQILLDIQARLFEDRGDHRVRIEGHHEGRPVRRALGDLDGAERAGRAGLVFHQHGAAELGLQMRLQQPRQRVGGTARRERHHQRHVLGLLRQRRRHRERGRRRQQSASGNLHQVSPPDYAALFFFVRRLRQPFTEVPKPDPAFLYSGRGGLKMSSTRAPSGPARMVCGTLPGVRQKSPFLTAISSPP